MKLNYQPEISEKNAVYNVNSFDLQSYLDVISIRSLPIYEVKDRNVIFPVTYLDGYIKNAVKLPVSITEELFDYQKVIVKVSWLKERYAIFADAGLGKTLVFGELIRQIYYSSDERIIVCIPLNILHQFEEMVQEFFPDFPKFDHLHNSKMTLDEWCIKGKNRIAFVNHEAFIKDVELKNIGAFFLDESSVLKGGIGGNGKIAQSIIKATKGIKRKYAASATPSPNDRTEYAMHALFLEVVRSEKEFYSIFFVNKDNRYVLRKHAERAFYSYLAHFSIFIRHPAAYGFDDNLKDMLPWKEVFKHIDMTDEQMRFIRKMGKFTHKNLLYEEIIKPKNMKQRGKFSQISKGFIYNDDGSTTLISSDKPKTILDIVQEHSPEQILIWTVFDEEGDILHRTLKDAGINAVHITGQTKETDRIDLIDKFRHNQIQVIISKPRILGFGLNFQFCHIAIYSGLQDSYEKYYQSVKRIHRYGQTKQVLIYHVITDYEQAILDNVLNKQESADADFEYQETLYIQSLYRELEDFLQMDNPVVMEKQVEFYEPTITDDYEIYHADSVKAMLEIKNGGSYGSLKPNSVDLSVFSPPFMGDIFTYSSDPADMGNTRGAGAEGGLDEYMLQFRFFLEGMLAVTKPGRIMAMHLEDVPLRKGLDGHVGIFDFVGAAIREANKAGWILVGKIPILKNQQMQSIVKHVSSLTMTNMEKDRIRIAPAGNGYLCLFKKPGDNAVPVADLAKCEDCKWRGYASELINYDAEELRPYKNFKMNGGDKITCPKCESKNILTYSEMDGNKWIIFAEGVWPENDKFNQDFDTLSRITQKERWNDLVQTALGVWFDIRESDTLNNPFAGNNKSEEDSDKHLCPLPLSVARRAVTMYSLPGERVFTPFAGIGTEVVSALELGRKAVGFELKPEYFLKAIENAKSICERSVRMELF